MGDGPRKLNFFFEEAYLFLVELARAKSGTQRGRGNCALAPEDGPDLRSGHGKFG